RASGRATGVIGTIEYRVGAERWPASQTTPEAVELQSLPARMGGRGGRAVAVEGASHGPALHRAHRIGVGVAVFTNLTQDHLDFHGTLDAYRDAKARLFRLLAAGHKPRRTAVINGDDAAGAAMVAGIDVPVLRYGLGAPADVRPRQFASGVDG